MDTKKYAQLCQKISLIPSGVGGIKRNIPPELLVMHDDIIYYPVDYKLTFDKGIPIHRAVLHDLKANSQTEIDVEKVVEYEQR